MLLSIKKVYKFFINFIAANIVLILAILNNIYFYMSIDSFNDYKKKLLMEVLTIGGWMSQPPTRPFIHIERFAFMKKWKKNSIQIFWLRGWGVLFLMDYLWQNPAFWKTHHSTRFEALEQYNKNRNWEKQTFHSLNNKLDSFININVIAHSFNTHN